jgi:glyoxylase-like metal-dependent hydrolase (beta-lactamase superfamily II)
VQIMTGLAVSRTKASRHCMQAGAVSVHRVADMEGVGWPVAAVFRDLSADMLQEAAACYPACAEPQAGKLMLDFSSYIIDMPGCLVLVDCGIGNGKERPDRPLWHRRYGDFLSRLGALGYAPEDFDIVINTHLHADHVGWNTVADGAGWKIAFPKARYIVPRIELDHVQALARSQPEDHVLHGAYIDSVKPVIEARAYEAVELPCEIAPGLRLEPAPGHTPGMAVLRLDLGGRDMMFLADVMHSPLQLATPDLTSNFCADPAQARATRHRLLDACARSEAIVATYHFPPPAFGRIESSGAGYRFRPVT